MAKLTHPCGRLFAALPRVFGLFVSADCRGMGAYNSLPSP